MLRFFDISYDELNAVNAQELYQLRKITFQDRLNWNVSCVNNMENDRYDNTHTTYIIGECKGKIICSVRFINLEHSNMITHTFNHCFNHVNLPGNYVESSRFFVDKNRAKQLLGNDYPISIALYLAMINYVRKRKYEGIYTIVSRAMLTILKRTGWNIAVIQEAYLKPNEPIYLLDLPIDLESQSLMKNKIYQSLAQPILLPEQWPFSLPTSGRKG